MKIYRLAGNGARYGLGELPKGGRPDGVWGAWIVLHEQGDKHVLGVQIAKIAAIREDLGEIDDHASDQERFDTLAALENIGRSWAQQHEREEVEHD